MSRIDFTLIELGFWHKDKLIEILGDGDANNVSSKDKEIVKSYFEKDFLGYGAWTEEEGIIGYCFIKYPTHRPETLTVVLSEYRNKGVATELRTRAIACRKFEGNIVYSVCRFDNIGSFKSLLKSGFQVFDVTKDNHIQFIKILPYKRN